MPRMVRIILLAGCLAGTAWALAGPAPKPARDSAPLADKSDAELSVEAIQRKIKQVETATNLEEPVRKSLLETYQTALEHVQTAEEYLDKATEFRKATDKAPEQLERLKAKLGGPKPDLRPQITPEMGLAEMQQALSEAEEAFEKLQKRLAELQDEPKRRTDRRIEIAKLQEAAISQLDEVEKLHDAAPAAGGATDPAVAATRVLLSARRHALEHELKVYQEELRHYELTGDLLEARRDHALVLSEHIEQHVKAWRSAVNDRRRLEAEEETKAAQEALQHVHAAARRLAEENAALAAQRQELTGRIDAALNELDSLKKQVDDLHKLFNGAKERVKRVGLTESIGLLLRKHRETIPDIAEHQHLISERKAEISKLSLQVVDLEEKRATLARIDEETDRILAEAKQAGQGKKAPSAAEIREFLVTMKNYVDELIQDANTQLETLAKLDTKELELVVAAREYSEFTEEYILWIRSARLPQPGDAAQLREAVAWIVAPQRWSAVGEAFVSDTRTHTVAYLASLIAVLSLVFSQRFWRKLLRTAGRDAGLKHKSTIWPTILALVATLLLSAVWPLTLWMAGWRLMHLAGRSEFLVALARALEGGALFLMTINFTRHLCRTLGLGEAHFEWPQSGLTTVRRSMWWLTAAGLPLAGIVLMTEAQGDEAIKSTLGRLAFVALQGLLAVSAYRVWQGPHGLARVIASSDADRWWIRVCRVGHVTSLAAPVVLAAAAIVGYYYTAVQLAQRLLVTSWLGGGLLVVDAVLCRWLLLAYRDLAMQRLREQRAAEALARSADEHQADPDAAEPTVRLADINHQAHQLLGMALCCAFLIGCSVIWVELSPAVEILDWVQLWPNAFAIIEPAEKPDLSVYILTLGALVKAVLAALVTVAAARNVPGLIEMTILRRLKLDSGARYAIGAVTQYLISVFGVSLAFGQMGVGWQNVQWLAAALTVGLGFGLQEIFANFISGLLLLVERPIRIGDTVTIGDVTGKVHRIHIRATTITDGDMRELIVPNKEFITGKVINWTLSDTTSRMTIKISVPNGSDPDLVQQLLLAVAASNPLVLKDPPPHALFDEFAGDSLNFTLRVYMGSRDVYNQLRHELNAAINAALQQLNDQPGHADPDGPIRAAPHAA